MNKNDKMAAQINLIKLPINTKFAFDLDQNTPWVQAFLIELNENATEKSPEEYLQETEIKISGEIEKKNKVEMSEFLLMKGTITATYVTECIRTLRPMSMDLEVHFKVCFIDESLSTSELFADIDETYVENDVYEIYFYNKRTVNFEEMIHEQIFLNYDQYPVLDAESKLVGVDH